MPADNERFYESGGVCPPELLCEFESAPPAQCKAATSLGANGRQRGGQGYKNHNNK